MASATEKVVAMSRTFDAVLRLAQREVERTKRSVSILLDERGEYDLVFADEYLDDPDVVHTVSNSRFFLPTYDVGEATATGRSGIDLMIDELRAVFGENRYTGVLH